MCASLSQQDFGSKARGGKSRTLLLPRTLLAWLAVIGGSCLVVVLARLDPAEMKFAASPRPEAAIPESTFQEKPEPQSSPCVAMHGEPAVARPARAPAPAANAALREEDLRKQAAILASQGTVDAFFRVVRLVEDTPQSAALVLSDLPWKLTDPAFIDFLWRQLEATGDDFTLALAQSIFASTYDPRILDQLILRAQQTAGSEDQQRYCHVIRLLRDPEAVDQLLYVLSEDALQPLDEVGAAVVDTLTAIGTDEAVQELGAMLVESARENGPNTQHLIQSLSSVHTPEAQEFLERLALCTYEEIPSPVRLAATKSLALYQGDEVLNVLFRLGTDSDASLRAESQASLLKIYGVEAPAGLSL